MRTTEPLDIPAVLLHAGPLTGSELAEHFRQDILLVWRECLRDDRVCLERVGRRYLRLDREVAGYARLSPSIRREFLTYTVIGLTEQTQEVRTRALALEQEIRGISRAKLQLAAGTMASVVESVPGWVDVQDSVCFVIAGDITYDMAHAVPRPESSTGRMVRGSDLDVVIIAGDDVPEEALRGLDDAVYKKKHFLLVHPAYQEEIDYLIKRVSKVREQLAFDSFEHMVASKILSEGLLLHGSEALFGRVKLMLTQAQVEEKLARLERTAMEKRRAAEATLLASNGTRPGAAEFKLFYTREEGDEIY
jgi:hypothetical protein